MCNDIYVTALVLRKKHCGLKYFVKLILDFVPNCLWAQSYYLPQDLLGPQGTLCSPGSRCPFSQTVPTQEEPPPLPPFVKIILYSIGNLRVQTQTDCSWQIWRNQLYFWRQQITHGKKELPLFGTF